MAALGPIPPTKLGGPTPCPDEERNPGCAAQATDRQRRLYEAIAETTPDLMYVFDLNHRFTYANKALLEMWGRTWEDAIGKNCLELGYEPWHAAMHDREIEEVVATKRPVRGVVAFTGTHGRRFYDYIFAPVIGADGEVEAIAGTTRDVTEQRQAAAAARFLSDLTHALAVISDPAEIIRHSVGAVGRHFGSHRCYFVECHEQLDLIKVSENWVRDHAPNLEGTYTLSEFGGREWWREYARGDFVVADVHRHPLVDARAAARAASIGVISYAVQPMKRAGEWTSVLAVTENTPRTWTKDEILLLENVAARVWPLVERARADAALRAARDEALAASRAKDRFLATLSHELRTPLNPALLLASDAARNPHLPQEVRADFATIAHHVTVEARLIDDLLDLTRITHDKLLLCLVPLDLHALIRHVVRNFADESGARNLRIMTHLEAPAATVNGDEVRLQQILWNLLRNAVKFTAPEGRITVTTRIDPPGSDRIQVELADSGLGMTESELLTVFEPFAQGDHAEGATRNRFGGLGLGLTIARRLAELHGGSISARSAGRNQGSAFTVELPLAAGPGKPPTADRPTEAPARASSSRLHRVLLVEDHEASRQVLARLLESRSLEVVQAGSAGEALDHAAHAAFDLVISDIGLPDRSGYELMATLHSRHGCRGIALSGYGTEDDVARSRHAGFLTHLTKPVQAHVLDRVLREVAGK